jgi:two-component system sensor histidine kinase UhpB
MVLLGCVFLAVQAVFNKALTATAEIVATVKIIESGHYQKKLPDFAIQEYQTIAQAINHLTEVLSQAQQQNRALTQHTLVVQKHERQRLAQELHDELGQSLTAIKAMAAWIKKANGGTAEAADAIIASCDHLFALARSMMQQLHPLILAELGLKTSLEDLLGRWSSRNPALLFELICPDEVDKLEQNIAIQLFRVIQECLTNAMRHAQATKVTVFLVLSQGVESGQQLSLEICDNGCGAAMEKVHAGFGLLSIRERINSLGGQLLIQTAPLQGMRILVEVPLR